MVDWIKPSFSKKRIGKAGEVLIRKVNENITYAEAVEIMSNWRGSHAFPLNAVQNCLRNLAKQVTNDFLIAQRLKRKRSITAKLERFPEMKLNRMQDIGGCRAILPTIEEVYLLAEKVKTNPTLNIIREYDYIFNPKPSGYRGIHLISKYSGKRKEFEGLQLEIQIRTKIQHSWATAVEIIDTFTEQTLKTGGGSEEWQNFFKMTSTLLSNIENNITIDSTLLQKLNSFDQELKAREKLMTYSLLTNLTEELEKKKGLFLLMLNLQKRLVNIKHFKKKELEKAVQKYKQEEETLNLYSDIVLVETQSINDLRKGYPNYFADSNHFLEILRSYLSPI